MTNLKGLTILLVMGVAGFPVTAQATVVPIAQQDGPTQSTDSHAGDPVLTLDAAQRLAAENNPTYQNVGETIAQADAMIQSAWSMLLPNLSANGSITRNKEEVAITMPTGPTTSQKMIIQDLWARQFGFSANITLFNPRSIPLIKNAYDMAEQTKLQAMIAKNDLLFAVTSAYYQVNSLEELTRVAQENLALAKEFEASAQSRLASGQATKIDVLRAQLEVNSREKELINATDAHGQALTALGYLVGREGSSFTTQGPDTETIVEDSPEELKKQALSKRLEVKTAQLDESIARRSKVDTYMKWLPSFDLTYNWSWNSAAGFGGDNDTWMLIFGAKWSLLEGGGRIAELKQKESSIRMAANSLDQVELDIRKEVELNQKQVKRLERHMEISDRQLSLADENHNMVNKQYEAGIVTSLDVLNATYQLTTSRISKVLDRLSYDIAVLTLKKSIGEYSSLSE